MLLFLWKRFTGKIVNVRIREIETEGYVFSLLSRKCVLPSFVIFHSIGDLFIVYFKLNRLRHVEWYFVCTVNNQDKEMDKTHLFGRQCWSEATSLTRNWSEFFLVFRLATLFLVSVNMKWKEIILFNIQLYDGRKIEIKDSFLVLFISK